MNEALAFLPAEVRKRLVKKKMPDWLDPMLATLTRETFSDPQWVYERKLDGVRVLVVKKGEKVRLYSRNRKDISSTYPELVEQLQEERNLSCILDGEVVAFAGNRTSFARLQKRMQIKESKKARASGVAVYLYLFDILHLNSYSTTDIPQRLRKEILKRALNFDGRLRFTAHRNEKGEEYHEQACRKGWEGVIAKDGEASYAHSRSRKWLKFKCSMRQELVIGGWTEPKGERKGFGALLVGYYRNGALIYAGKVGTGYDDQTLQNLHETMSGLERSTSPFETEGKGEKDVHYCKPELVAEIGFTEWTEDGRLRHPRFLGLRDDKKAGEVVREDIEGAHSF